jgi:hypothetical protein
MAEETYSCRECSWSGKEPERTPSHFIGPVGGVASTTICPKCQKDVRTEGGWHRHDNPTFFDKEWNFFWVLTMVVGLGTLAIIFLSS